MYCTTTDIFNTIREIREVKNNSFKIFIHLFTFYGIGTVIIIVILMIFDQ